jgi:PTS system mannose-specific IID component
VSAIRDRDLDHVAVRAELLQATWNYERQQGVGWAWALEPVLRRLYPSAPERARRLAEHTAYFNTQPTLASLALGAVAKLEEARARGEDGVDAGTIARIKSVLGSSLAALGDRVFWLTLRPFTACLGIALALAGWPWAAAVQWLAYNLAHQTVRLAGVRWGYREGPAIAAGPLRHRLEQLMRLAAIAGSGAIGIIVAMLLVPGGMPRSVPFQLDLAVGLTVGLLAASRARPSPTEWALGFGVIALVVAWL